jgi:transposase-like protein
MYRFILNLSIQIDYSLKHRTKCLTGEDGEMVITFPCDRNVGFVPKIVKKDQRRFDGFNDKITSMYTRELNESHERPFNMKRQQRDLMHVLLRSIDTVRMFGAGEINPSCFKTAMKKLGVLVDFRMKC